MQLPLQITFRNMEASPAIEAKVRERAAKLDRFFDHIMSCRVSIEAPHKHHHQGNLFHVRIDITVPGNELVVSREPRQHQAHEDAYVVLRDAFDAMQRQLEDYVRKLKHEVKTHEVPPHGHVSRLQTAEGYGLITTADGREVYFHRNSVLNAEYDRLAVGDEVRFTEEMGELGPQASSVSRIGKHHPVG